MSKARDVDGKGVEIVDVESDDNTEDVDDYGHMQMELFASATTEKTTNSIHLYDIAPKFTYSRKERGVSESAFDKRAMKVASEEYEVEVQAARIQRDGGEEFLIYPGKREECSEDSLRKLAPS